MAIPLSDIGVLPTGCVIKYIPDSVWWRTSYCIPSPLSSTSVIKQKGFGFTVFNATFNNISGISWLSVLSVEETRAPGENHWPVASHWQTLSHNVVSSTFPWTGFEFTTIVVIDTDCLTFSNCILQLLDFFPEENRWNIWEKNHCKLREAIF